MLLRLLLVTVLLLGGLAADDAVPAGGKYYSPRATMRIFLTAVEEARENPDRIHEAVQCLDLGDLAPDDPTLPLAAYKLEATLRALDIETSRCPDKMKMNTWHWPEHSEPAHSVGLHRKPDGKWLFDPYTIKHISRLWAEVRNELEERQKEMASLNLPPEFASPRDTLRTFISAMAHDDLNRGANCLDLKHFPPYIRDEIGQQFASKLYQILKRHRPFILQDVPNTNYSDSYVLLSTSRGVLDLQRQNSGERKGQWLLSSSGVDAIPQIFDEVEPLPYHPDLVSRLEGRNLDPEPLFAPELWIRKYLPEWLKHNLLNIKGWQIETYQVIGFAVLLILAFFLYWMVVAVLDRLLSFFLHLKGHDLSEKTIHYRLRPFGTLAALVLPHQGAMVLNLDRVPLMSLLLVLKPIVIVTIAWLIFQVIDLMGDLILASNTLTRLGPNATLMLWPVASMAVKIGIVLFTLFKLMTMFSWDPTAMVTSLGIGGLAFALGAQDTLKNFFGSFTLIADRPFVVGEEVKIGKNQEGVVEAVGIRSTRFRASDDTIMTIPNSNLTTMSITNYGKRRYRHYHTTLSVSRETPIDRILAFRDQAQEIICKQDTIRNEGTEVSLYDISATTIKILFNIFFQVNDRDGELKARSEFLVSILKLAESLEIKLEKD